jgi:hypothetical protein
MPARRARLQRQRLSDRACWAHTKGGRRCTARVTPGELPYCNRHLTSGDGAFKKVRHPDKRLGTALVARMALPKGYRLVFWGDRSRCPYIEDDDRTLQYLSGISRGNPNGVIDPAPYDGSVGQFMNSPAPSELTTARGTQRYWGKHNESGLVGQEFVLTRALRPNHQVSFWAIAF